MKRLFIILSFLVVLLPSLYVFKPFPSSAPKTRRLAIMIRKDFLEEISFAHRIHAACSNLDWQAVNLVLFRTILDYTGGH
ncbi:MAG: hypothetical protein K1X28_08345 [Parachlamydiales bacterium]|nr:hypothetical protein [Parachlamydiales bacterium]